MTRPLALIIGRIRWWKWRHWDGMKRDRKLLDEWDLDRRCAILAEYQAAEPAEWRPM